MASPSSSAENGDQSEFSVEDSSAKPASSPHHKMSQRNRALFFVTAWLIVLMPFLFWWNTWFGRQLPDKQITEYLQDEKHPRHIQDRKSTRLNSSHQIISYAVFFLK